MIVNQGQLTPKIKKLARIGEWATSVGLLIAVAIFAYSIWLLSVEDLGEVQELTDTYGFGSLGFELTGGSQWVALGFWLLPDIVGIWLLLAIRKLFIGLRKQGVFLQLTAKRLRLIGWLVVVLAPINMLAELLGSAVLSLMQGRGQLVISVGFEDADVYAVVIGLLLVVVAQILLEAIRIYEENDAFV